MKRIALTVCIVLALGGCAAAEAHVVSPHTAAMDGEAYASALAEAFDAYEHEVDSASTLTFGSPAEAEAVMQTLSEARFEWQLRQSLARRGVRMADLARYAELHPTFADQQQRAYAGRLDHAQMKVQELAQHVRSMDDYLLASD
jgi:hypothetical protein